MESIPDKALSFPGENPDWNTKEVPLHIVVIPRFMIVEAIDKPAGPRIVLKRMFDCMNERITCLGARGKTRKELISLYDRSCQMAQEALEKVMREDFTKNLYYLL